MKVELCLQVENNRKFVHGEGKVRNEIEQFILSQFAMEKLAKHNCRYILSIPYTSDEELDSIIYDEIIADDIRNLFIEADIFSVDDPERSW